MERRQIYIEGFSITELYFDNKEGAIRGGISYMGVDMVYDPVSKVVVHDNMEGMDWLYSSLNRFEAAQAERIIAAVVGVITMNMKRSLT